MNICWYEDEEIGIFFDTMPNVSVKYLNPDSDNSIKKETYEKPFYINNDVGVTILDYIENVKHFFVIPSLYSWDGASIPRFFWRLIGANTDNRFLIPSLLHDFMCENHECIDSNRYLSTMVFERMLYVSKINPFARWMMKHSVDNYQKFCNWEN